MNIITDLDLIYLVGWLLVVFDLPADHKSTWWCVGAAIGCVLWPLLLARTVIDKLADIAARNVK